MSTPAQFTPGGVLRALADVDPARWATRERWTPGADVDGLRDDEWVYVFPASWAAVTGKPGGDVLAVLYGRGDLAVPESWRRKGQWTAPAPRWSGKGSAYKVRAAALADPAPDPVTGNDVAGLSGPAAVLSWRAMLGQLCPGAEPCPEHCPCAGQGIIRYTGDHTGTVCEICGPEECWTPSPSVERRAAAHLETVKGKAVSTRTATAAVPQAELDQRAIALNRRISEAVEYIQGALARPEVKGDIRADLTWLLGQYPGARTESRCDELDTILAGVELPRQPAGRIIRGFFTRDVDGDEIAVTDLADVDGQDDDPADDDPAAAGLAGDIISRFASLLPAYRREIAAGISSAQGYEPCGCGKWSDPRWRAPHPNGAVHCRGCGGQISPPAPPARIIYGGRP